MTGRGDSIASPRRTTLDIGDDVLQAAKELPARDGITAGRVICERARRGLQVPEGKGRVSRSITDVYLLALAVKQRGTLATIDQTIPLSAALL